MTFYLNVGDVGWRIWEAHETSGSILGEHEAAWLGPAMPQARRKGRWSRAGRQWWLRRREARLTVQREGRDGRSIPSGAPPPLSANPPPWPVLRAAVRPVLPSRSHASRPRWLAWWSRMRAGPAWFFTRPQAWWQGVPAWRFTLGVGGAVLALIGLVAFLLDLENRREERVNREEDRINRAWSLVAAAKVEGTGNVGLIEALETLASRGINLSQIKLPGAYLAGVHLVGADLDGADLSGADLSGAEWLLLAKLERTRFCQTTMPDNSVCNRGCEARMGNDRSCPFLGEETPEQQSPQGAPNPPSPGQVGGTKDAGR
jgi:hypothetical protein